MAVGTQKASINHVHLAYGSLRGIKHFAEIHNLSMSQAIEVLLNESISLRVAMKKLCDESEWFKNDLEERGEILEKITSKCKNTYHQKEFDF